MLSAHSPVWQLTAKSRKFKARHNLGFCRNFLALFLYWNITFNIIISYASASLQFYYLLSPFWG